MSSARVLPLKCSVSSTTNPLFVGFFRHWINYACNLPESYSRCSLMDRQTVQLLRSHDRSVLGKNRFRYCLLFHSSSLHLASNVTVIRSILTIDRGLHIRRFPVCPCPVTLLCLSELMNRPRILANDIFMIIHDFYFHFSRFQAK